MEEVEVKARRGRPAREGNEDPQSTLTLIRDEVMEPFYIVKDTSNFTVMESFVSVRGFGGKAATGKKQEKVIGHYTSFSNALNSVARQKFYQNQGEYKSIKEYIQTWNVVKDGITNLLKSIEI